MLVLCASAFQYAKMFEMFLTCFYVVATGSWLLTHPIKSKERKYLLYSGIYMLKKIKYK